MRLNLNIFYKHSGASISVISCWRPKREPCAPRPNRAAADVDETRRGRHQLPTPLIGAKCNASSEIVISEASERRGIGNGLLSGIGSVGIWRAAQHRAVSWY